MLISHALLTPQPLIILNSSPLHSTASGCLLSIYRRTLNNGAIVREEAILGIYPRVVSLCLPHHWTQITIPATDKEDTVVVVCLLPCHYYCDIYWSCLIRFRVCCGVAAPIQCTPKGANNKLTWNRWHIIRIPASTARNTSVQHN